MNYPLLLCCLLLLLLAFCKDYCTEAKLHGSQSRVTRRWRRQAPSFPQQLCAPGAVAGPCGVTCCITMPTSSQSQSIQRPGLGGPLPPPPTRLSQPQPQQQGPLCTCTPLTQDPCCFIIQPAPSSNAAQPQPQQLRQQPPWSPPIQPPPQPQYGSMAPTPCTCITITIQARPQELCYCQPPLFDPLTNFGAPMSQSDLFPPMQSPLLSSPFQYPQQENATPYPPPLSFPHPPTAPQLQQPPLAPPSLSYPPQYPLLLGSPQAPMMGPPPESRPSSICICASITQDPCCMPASVPPTGGNAQFLPQPPMPQQVAPFYPAPSLVGGQQPFPSLPAQRQQPVQPPLDGGGSAGGGTGGLTICVCTPSQQDPCCAQLVQQAPSAGAIGAPQFSPFPPQPIPDPSAMDQNLGMPQQQQKVPPQLQAAPVLPPPPFTGPQQPQPFTSQPPLHPPPPLQPSQQPPPPRTNVCVCTVNSPQQDQCCVLPSQSPVAPPPYSPPPYQPQQPPLRPPLPQQPPLQQSAQYQPSAGLGPFPPQNQPSSFGGFGPPVQTLSNAPQPGFGPLPPPPPQQPPPYMQGGLGQQPLGAGGAPFGGQVSAPAAQTTTCVCVERPLPPCCHREK